MPKKEPKKKKKQVKRPKCHALVDGKQQCKRSVKEGCDHCWQHVPYPTLNITEPEHYTARAVELDLEYKQKTCKKRRLEQKDVNGDPYDIYYHADLAGNKYKPTLDDASQTSMTTRKETEPFLHILNDHLPTRYSDLESKLEPCGLLSSSGRCLALPFKKTFQQDFVRFLDMSVLTLPCKFADMPSILLINLIKWYHLYGDAKFNAAYRLFWQKKIIVECWLALSCMLNWIILSAPRLTSEFIVYRGDDHVPRVNSRDTIILTSFLSTSWSLAEAKKFNRHKILGMYEIVLPAGFPLLSIGTFEDRHQGEDEILLPATLDVNGLAQTYGLRVHSVRKTNAAHALMVRLYPVLLPSNFVGTRDDDVWGPRLRKGMAPAHAKYSLHKPTKSDDADDLAQDWTRPKFKRPKDEEQEDSRDSFAITAEKKEKIIKGRPINEVSELYVLFRDLDHARGKAYFAKRTVDRLKDHEKPDERQIKKEQLEYAKYNLLAKEIKSELKAFSPELKDLIQTRLKLNDKEFELMKCQNNPAEKREPHMERKLDREITELKEQVQEEESDKRDKLYKRVDKTLHRSEKPTTRKEMTRVLQKEKIASEKLLDKFDLGDLETFFQVKFDSIYDEICKISG